MVDISDEMVAQEALRAREHLLRRLTETLPQGILQVDASGRIIYRNERVTSLLGYAGSTTLYEQLVSVLPPRVELCQALNAVLHEGRDRDLR